jgi:hypothetical protein
MDAQERGPVSRELVDRYLAISTGASRPHPDQSGEGANRRRTAQAGSAILMAWMGDYIACLVGTSEVSGLDVRLRSAVSVGDLIILRGEHSPRPDGSLGCSILATNQDGKTLAQGTAELTARGAELLRSAPDAVLTAEIGRGARRP